MCCLFHFPSLEIINSMTLSCFCFYSLCEGFSSAELVNNSIHGNWTIGSANELRTTCLNWLLNEEDGDRLVKSIY